MTIKGAGDGKTDSGSADAEQPAKQDKPAGKTKIAARARRKGKRKRKRKAPAKAKTVRSTASDDTTPVSDDGSTGQPLEPKSDGTAEDMPELTEAGPVSAVEETTELPAPEPPADRTLEPAGAEPTNTVEETVEPTATESDESAAPSEQDGLSNVSDEKEHDTLDGAYSTHNTLRSGQANGDTNSVGLHDSGTKAAADDRPEADDPETQAEPPTAKVDAEAEVGPSHEIDNGSADQPDAAEDSGSSSDVDSDVKSDVKSDSGEESESPEERALAAQRIDDLLSLVGIEPGDGAADNSSRVATPSDLPNIDDLFTGAIDKSQDELPPIDDVFPPEKVEIEPSGEVDESDLDASDSQSSPTGDVAPPNESEQSDATALEAESIPAPVQESNPIVVVAPSRQPARPLVEVGPDDSAAAPEAETPEPLDAEVASSEVTAAPMEAPRLPVGPLLAPTQPRVEEPAPQAEPPAPTPSGEFPPSSQEKPTGGGARLLKWTAIIAIVAYALLVAAWGINVLSQQDKVATGVQIGSLDASNLTKEALSDGIDALEADLSTEGLVVVVDEEMIETNPAAMGVQIDKEKLTAAALDARRGGFVLLRPFAWLGQFGSTEEVAIPYLYDSSKAEATTDLAIVSRLESPVEPAFGFDEAELVATEGAAGITVELEEINNLLPQAIEAGAPYRMVLNPTQATPTVKTELVAALAAEINALTEEPIVIRILDDEIEANPKTMREWAGLILDGDNTSWKFDNDLMIADLKPRFRTLGTDDQQARIKIINEKPTIINASETVICCERGVDKILLETLQADSPKPPETDGDDPDADPGKAPLRQAVFKPEVVGFDEGVAELESLGIVEKVSTFTTKHACCANRVKNIQRFAELMQGTIVRPGETLSLNDTVGRRTTAKGFFSDGAIVNGELKPSIGGGISQYATTFLNAAFFSGVDITEYRAHSRYISRYPEGREATLDFGSIDLKIRNDTDYGILVWNEWTSTSITVSFYSTKNAEVTALPTQVSNVRGLCKTVTTPRLVEYLGDRPAKRDEVFADYVSEFNKRCDGTIINLPEDEEEAGEAAE